MAGVAVASFPTRCSTRSPGKLGEPLDGLLGLPFLREFAVTIDYPAGRLGLRRCAPGDHVLDRYRRVGYARARLIVGRYRVAIVYRDSDAARQNVAVEQETIESVGGRTLASPGRHRRRTGCCATPRRVPLAVRVGGARPHAARPAAAAAVMVGARCQNDRARLTRQFAARVLQTLGAAGDRGPPRATRLSFGVISVAWACVCFARAAGALPVPPATAQDAQRLARNAACLPGRSRWSVLAHLLAAPRFARRPH